METERRKKILVADFPTFSQICFQHKSSNDFPSDVVSYTLSSGLTDYFSASFSISTFDVVRYVLRLLLPTIKTTKNPSD